MKPSLDDLLCARYDALFAGRNRPTSETPMGRGFACEDGWFDLIDRLCADIQAEVAKGATQPVAAQVKEKLGELRFYVHGRADPAIYALIDDAAERSGKVCEVCGRPGRLMLAGGWIHAACSEHARPVSTPLLEAPSSSQQLGARKEPP